jgi:hypothetical protein
MRGYKEHPYSTKLSFLLAEEFGSETFEVLTDGVPGDTCIDMMPRILELLQLGIIILST